MQLSASTLPFDPNSALPAAYPGVPTSANDGGAPLGGAGEFGALLNAETSPAVETPAAAPAPFVLGVKTGAADDAAPIAEVPPRTSAASDVASASWAAANPLTLSPNAPQAPAPAISATESTDIDPSDSSAEASEFADGESASRDCDEAAAASPAGEGSNTLGGSPGFGRPGRPAASAGAQVRAAYAGCASAADRSTDTSSENENAAGPSVGLPTVAAKSTVAGKNFPAKAKSFHSPAARCVAEAEGPTIAASLPLANVPGAAAASVSSESSVTENGSTQTSQPRSTRTDGFCPSSGERLAPSGNGRTSERIETPLGQSAGDTAATISPASSEISAAAAETAFSLPSAVSAPPVVSDATTGATVSTTPSSTNAAESDPAIEMADTFASDSDRSPAAAKLAEMVEKLSGAGISLVDLTVASSSTPENFAAASTPPKMFGSDPKEGGLKKSLSFDKEAVVGVSSGLGTNVAKSRPTMSTLVANAVRSSSEDAASAFSVPALDIPSLTPEPAPLPASDATPAARRAVESVLAVTDHFTTTGGQHGVNLKFSVSGVDLAVRVEIRGDHVETTFRTDSPELRAALAHEWHAVAAEAGERTQHLSEPVFTASRDSSSDAGGFDQRGSNARQGQPSFDESGAPRQPLRRSTAFAPTTVGSSVAPTTVSLPGRLRALA